MYKNILVIIILFSFLTLISCKEPDETPSPQNSAVEANEKILTVMKEWYLWNDQLPNIKASDYSSPKDFLDALLYSEVDKWSYIQDEKTFKQYFQEGKFFGFGFGMKLDGEENLRVTFVHKDSPMDKANITRGYKIVSIGGTSVAELIATNALSSAFGANQAGVAVNMEVEGLEGVKRQISVTKEEVKINSVLHREVKEVDGVKVGYLVFNNFVATSIVELDEAFVFFKQEGVTELALDLRYNGGGSLNVAQYLANLIGASKGGTGKFVELTYNAAKQNSNQPYNFSSELSGINLERLFVITSRGTASASEAIINGLRPYMQVITVGDYTGGKPVGMNTFIFDGYALVPITFKVNNSLGEAEYFEGISPDGASLDDLSVLFGDDGEDSFQEVLYYIKNGAFSASSARTKQSASQDVIQLQGFQAEIGAF
ncbi:MAG: S41 family peptidase [Bacteroidota bacterium]|nr:S41 family peptidase [Bacteroidota bacterium]